MSSTLKYVLLSAIMTLLFVVTKSGHANSNFSAFSETMRTVQLRLPNVTIRDTLHGIGIAENLFRTMNNRRITDDYNNPATVFTGSGFLYGSSVNHNIYTNHLPNYLTPGILPVKKNFTMLMSIPHPAGHDILMTQQQPLLSYHFDTTATVPEPEMHTLVLLCIALLGVSARRRYKNI